MHFFYRIDWSHQTIAMVVAEDRQQERHLYGYPPPPSPPPSPPPFFENEQCHEHGKYERMKHKVEEILQSNRVTRQCFPPKGNTAVALTLILGAVAIFLVFRSVLGNTAAPGGPIFSLLVVILLSLIAGQLIKVALHVLNKIFKSNFRFPPFIAMLVIGVILRNVPYNFSQFQRSECYMTINNSTEVHVNSINNILNETQTNGSTTFDGPPAIPQSIDESCKPRYIGRDLDPAISGICRSTCLTVILLLAGLELDPVALPKLAGLFVSGTIVPCVAELVTAMVLAHYILGFPWLVAAILGVLLTGISAAVVIPSLVSLINSKYGVAKGIPTLAIACCASTDAFAIAGMGILTGIYFNNKDASLARLILQGPIEIIVGFLFGFLWGGIVQYLPDTNHHNLKFFRWLLLFCGGLISIFGSKAIEYEGAGGVATVVGSYIANKRWRAKGWEEHHSTEKNIKKMWIILSPVIFGLVGTEVQIDKLSGRSVGLGLAVLFGTVFMRTVVAYFSMWSSKFNWKEMLFLALSWVPKATVQAALGKHVVRFLYFN